jgi:hypothetical protein
MIHEDKKLHEGPPEPSQLGPSTTHSENDDEGREIGTQSVSISPSHQLEIGSEYTTGLSGSASCSRIDQLQLIGEDGIKIPEDKITSMGEYHCHQQDQGEPPADTSSPSIQEIEKDLMELDLKNPTRTD